MERVLGTSPFVLVSLGAELRFSWRCPAILLLLMERLSTWHESTHQRMPVMVHSGNDSIEGRLLGRTT